MPKASAGLLLYRKQNGEVEVLLVHPGGPFWAKKDLGAWSIPKGEVEEGEDYLTRARKEFEEEVGATPRGFDELTTSGNFLGLGSIAQKGGKVVHAWAFQGDCDPNKIKSNTFKMEWPPRSGKEEEFPEVDKAEFFSLEEARQKINPAQIEFLERLKQSLEL